MVLEPEVLDLLETFNIHSPPHRFVHSEEEIESALTKLKLPVVMKIVSPDILHKSDVGGVKVRLNQEEQVKKVFRDMFAEVGARCPQAHLAGALLVEQAPDGLEVIVGLTQDATFGTVLMFGLGGVFVEALRDVVFRAVPIEERAAVQMIYGIKNRAVLSGWRGGKPVNIHNLAGLLCRVSELSVRHPEIQELDLNPIRICGDELLVLDARLRENTV